MSATIQIIKTPQLEDTLSFIRSKYVLLSDEDIIKMSISSQYRILQQEDETDYLTSSPINNQRLNDAISQDSATARKYSNLDALKESLNF